MLSGEEIIEKLSRTNIYRDYESAFSAATELPLTLRSTKGWNLALHGHPRENPFCALLADSSKACAQCLENQHLILDASSDQAKTSKCFAGLHDTAIPVHAGDHIIGYLQTGQIALEKLHPASFEKITRQIVKWGSDVDLTQLHEAYFHSRIISRPQYEAMIRLLQIFATHLSDIANQLVVQEQEKEPSLIRRARAYIGDHHPEELTLSHLAGALHVSTFYFCKMFKKSTGLTFTDYLGRVRVEKAKALLLHGDLRVSEIAFQVGFQSLTHFNRIFRRLVGQSPSTFRRSAQHL